MAVSVIRRCLGCLSLLPSPACLTVHILMSLLVIGASKVGQGVIRGLQGSGKYERIVCADVFPSYLPLKQFLEFKDTLGASATKVSETKIADKTDLEIAIRGATQVVFVTHDYYRNVPSKLTFIKHAASLSKAAGIKTFVSVSPVESDHQGEANPIGDARKAIEEARTEFAGLVDIRSDLTFGKDSVAVNALLSRIANKKSIAFHPSNALISPVFTGDLALAVAKVLAGGATKLDYIARGEENLTFAALIQQLNAAIGVDALLNTCKIESVISPRSDNLISQAIYCANYQNLVQFIHNYQGVTSSENAGTLQDLGVSKLQKFTETYKANSINAANLQRTSDCFLIAGCFI